MAHPNPALRYTAAQAAQAVHAWAESVGYLSRRRRLWPGPPLHPYPSFRKLLMRMGLFNSI